MAPQDTEDSDALESAAEAGLNAAALSKMAGKWFQMLTKAPDLIDPFAKITKITGKRVPILGAAVTTVFVLKETADFAMDKKWAQAGASLVCGVPEIAGNIVGFGVGDLAREGVRHAFVYFGGDKFEDVQRSDLVTLGLWGAKELGLSDIFNDKAGEGYIVFVVDPDAIPVIVADKDSSASPAAITPRFGLSAQGMLTLLPADCVAPKEENSRQAIASNKDDICGPVAEKTRQVYVSLDIPNKSF